MNRPDIHWRDIHFVDPILDALRARHPQFHDTAYAFVLGALNHVIRRLPADRRDDEKRRHISGRELAEGVRDLALLEFGPMARTVLEYWGIHDTVQVGHIVFALIDAQILTKQDEDSLQDFEHVFDFDEAFGR